MINVRLTEKCCTGLFQANVDNKYLKTFAPAMFKALRVSVNSYSRRRVSLYWYTVMFKSKGMNPTLAFGETTTNEQLSVLITNKNLCT